MSNLNQTVRIVLAGRMFARGLSSDLPDVDGRFCGFIDPKSRFHYPSLRLWVLRTLGFGAEDFKLTILGWPPEQVTNSEHTWIESLDREQYTIRVVSSGLPDQIWVQAQWYDAEDRSWDSGLIRIAVPLPKEETLVPFEIAAELFVKRLEALLTAIGAAHHGRTYSEIEKAFVEVSQLSEGLSRGIPCDADILELIEIVGGFPLLSGIGGLVDDATPSLIEAIQSATEAKLTLLVACVNTVFRDLPLLSEAQRLKMGQEFLQGLRS
jgi:hypothetical protein